MPQVFKLGGYRIFFWMNEGNPVEPIHVHAAKGAPSEHATKIWITAAGGALVAENSSGIPASDLRDLLDVIAAQHEIIVDKWVSIFGSVSYYC